ICACLCTLDQPRDEFVAHEQGGHLMRGTKAPRSLDAAMLLATSALLPVGYLAIAALSCSEASAQAGAQSLPALTIDQPRPRPQRRRAESRGEETAIVRRIARRG